MPWRRPPGSSSPTRAWAPARTCATPSSPPAGPSAAGPAATPYNRGQVLYRVAEVLEGRRAQFIDEVGAGEGLTARAAATVVDAAIDRVVWYAGWTDKIAQVLGSLNPVAGPYFNVSAPEPTGVVGVLAPQASSLLGLVSVVAPVIASGNTAVVVSSALRPLPAVTLGRGARHLRPARWRRQHRHGADRRGRHVARRAPRRQRHRPHRGRRRRGGRLGRRSRPRPPATSSACCGRGSRGACPSSRTGPPPPVSSASAPSSRPRRSGTPRASELGHVGPEVGGPAPRPDRPSRVILLTGPSGAGKSRLAERLSAAHGWPVVRLDDFYREHDDPHLPRSPIGIPDWDHVDSWHADAAVEALRRLVDDGRSRCPSTTSARRPITGRHVLTAGPHDHVARRGPLRRPSRRAAARAGAAGRRPLRAPEPLPDRGATLHA